MQPLVASRTASDAALATNEKRFNDGDVEDLDRNL
jgi:hypothetical protein